MHKEKPQKTLPQEGLPAVCNSFDIVGDIAIIKITSPSVDATTASQQIMAVHKNVKTVLCQASAVRGDYRIRELKLLAGEDKTITQHRESGCTFRVDLEKCYFSPRLMHERSRIARLVAAGETVVNMFSGVGCFSILIAKTQPTAKVYSIDVNPTAVAYMEENVRINRVYGNVFPLLGDAKALVETRLRGVANRVLMPLPEKALAYLPVAVSALKAGGGWIHYYDFEHAAAGEDPLDKTMRKVAEKLGCLGVRFEVGGARVVRSTGPNWYQTVLDLWVA